VPLTDQDDEVLVLRIAYDGPPLSGKTTTLQTLARTLSVPITTPEERDGRTLFFDWVDYVGGRFEGRAIRCQILSTPGQLELTSRRRTIIESADAVVFVADSRPTEFGKALAWFDELFAWSQTKEPPVGIIVQANHRDAVGAVPRELVHAHIERVGTFMIRETIATRGEGVRETFVFAVRAALDRLRALSARGQLDSRLALEEDPTSLFERMGGDPSSPSSQLPPPRTERAGIFTPPATNGFLWPPIEGRALLDEVSRDVLEATQDRRGDWHASVDGWRVHSPRDHVWESVEDARAGLVQWARFHASREELFSRDRVLVLSQEYPDHLRLWQVVREHESLRERLEHAADRLAPDAFARELLETKALFERALDAPGATALPCSLWTVGVEDDAPRFVGLAPPATPEIRGPAKEDLVAREFGHALRALATARDDFDRVCATLDADPDGRALLTLRGR